MGMSDRRTGSPRRTAHRAVAAAAGGLLAAVIPAPAAVAAGGGACEHGHNNTYDKLL